jgi:cyanate lyase
MAVRINIATDFSGKGLDKARKEFAQLEGVGAKTAFALKKAFLPAVAALGALAGAGLKAVKAGEQAATSNARIEQVATSMGLYGSEVKKVTDRLVTLANKTALATGVDQNAIKLTQAKLLTFKELAKTATTVGGSFDRATKAAIDLAAAGFGEASSNAVQLGKALQDPIKGITALARSGVTFTAQEKEKIRVLVQSGRVLEAQELILAAIETQVGGTAEATANATDKIKVGFSQVSEAIGLALLPVFEKLSNALLAFSNWARENTAVFLATAAVVGTLATAIVAANVAMKIYNALGVITNGINKLLGSSFTRLQVAMGAVGVLLAAAVTVYALVSKSQDGNRQSTNKLTDALKLETKARQEAVQELIKNDKNVRTFYSVLQKLGFTQQQFIQYMKTGTGPIADNRKELKKLAHEAGVSWQDYGKFIITLKNARQDVIDSSNAAQILAGSLGAVGVQATSVSGDLTKFRELLGIGKTESTGFSTAINKIAEETKNLRQAFTSARQGVTEALKSMKKSLQDSLSGAITGAVNFGQIQSAAKDAGVSFMDALGAQVTKARDFAAKLQQLMRRGLSSQAISQVASAGADAGTEIANELLAGGAAAINQSNELVAAAELAAKETGSLAGATYYNEGTVLAQQLTKGITDIVSKYKIKLKSAGLTDKQLQRLQRRFALDVDFVMSGIPALAEGGIVRSPTLSLIGESGPEAVIPLNKMGQMGNVTINVSGGDPQAVVDALRRYMYQNGTVPIRVSG